MFNHMQRLVDEDESDNPIASTSRNDPEATSEQEDALSRYGEDLYSSFLVSTYSIILSSGSVTLPNALEGASRSHHPSYAVPLARPLHERRIR